jgi:hypothetical protein
MKIMGLTRRRPGATFEKIQALQGAEVGMVWQLMREGLIREIYFDKDKPAVVVIVEAESIEAARSRLNHLPMVAADLIEFDFTVLGTYTQLETLFER